MNQTAPLNVFQRVIRQWERVHPYNAAQVMKLAGPADAGRIEQAWNQAIATLGLGAVRVRRGRYGFEKESGVQNSDGAAKRRSDRGGRLPSVASSVRRSVAPVFPGQSPDNLEEHLVREMNRPFEDGELPFRPFILPAGARRAGTNPSLSAHQASHYVGLVYRHWVADSASIQLLMHQWFAMMYDPPSARLHPLRLPSGGYWRHFGPERGGWDLFRWLGDLPDAVWRFARSRRLQTRGSRDYRTGFVIRHAPDGWIDRLHCAARSRGVTVSDLFLTAMAIACPPCLPLQQRAGRGDIGLGSIVDLRPLSCDDLSDLFGLFLGFANVSFGEAERDDPEKLLRVIAQQTRRNKSRAAACASQVWLAGGLTARVFRPVHKFYQYYRKYMPLCAGLSNVNLNQTWAATYHPHPLLDYLRISPTGPTVPAVFTTTTLGRSFHLVATFRGSVVSQGSALAMVDLFFQVLDGMMDRRKNTACRETS